MIDRRRLEKAVRAVEKPGRYIGGEWNERRKDPRKVRIKIALVFPDVYEIGMSYLGQKILYSLLNGRPDVLAERVFAPWPDFESRLRSEGLPLYSLENKIPLHEFDIIGVSLLYELNYSNVLTILDLGGIPTASAERADSSPLIIAGGPAVFNPEPVAGIFDLFLAGDGEEAFLEIVDKVLSLKKTPARREDMLRELSGLRGAYVPAFYEAVRTEKSPLLVPRPIENAPARIRKRILTGFRNSPFPDRIVVPGVRTVFDRVAVEASRGCPQNCRFCQAASLYFPYRVKSPRSVVKSMIAGLRRTGYEDASLTALSIGDYPYLEETIKVLMDRLEKRKISLSLSSLRPKGLTPEILENIVKVRKTGLTLVPEAGTDRLRRVINKKLDDEDIREALTYAFSRGWKLVKLYFMVGLPTETDEDLSGIVDLVETVIDLGRKILKAPPRINLSVSSFIPKPHTPFQWLAMDDEKILVEKQEGIRSRLKRYKSVEFKKHPVRTSLLEAVFSRGDRRLERVLRTAWSDGARFESWGDQFRYDLWMNAFEREGISPGDYRGSLDVDAELPWDHIETGLKKSHLLKEMQAALEMKRSPSCRETDCASCAACDFPQLKEKAGAERIRINTSEPVFFRTKAKAPIRYRAVYAKQGPARLLSHIDLIHVLQRAFRRAGIDVAQSQGFHPKMLISYAPALPLGMEGRRELLEFRAAAAFESKAFLKRLNRLLPAGVRFLELTRLNADAPSLAQIIKKANYSLDLRDPEIRKALETAAGKPAIRSSSPLETLNRLIAAYLAEKSENVFLEVEAKTKKLLIAIPVSSGKSPRPQDIADNVLGTNHSVYALTRERFETDDGLRRPAVPA